MPYVAWSIHSSQLRHHRRCCVPVRLSDPCGPGWLHRQASLASSTRRHIEHAYTIAQSQEQTAATSADRRTPRERKRIAEGGKDTRHSGLLTATSGTPAFAEDGETTIALAAQAPAVSAAAATTSTAITAASQPGQHGWISVWLLVFASHGLGRQMASCTSTVRKGHYKIRKGWYERSSQNLWKLTRTAWKSK